MKKNLSLKIAFVFFAASLLLPTGGWQLCADACALAALSLCDWCALFNAGSLRFWLFPVLFVLLVPLLSAEGFGWRHYSIPQLEGGFCLLAHAYVFAALIAFGSRNFSIREVSEAFPAIGLRVALALCSARLLRRMIGDTWLTYRLTRPGWREVLGELDIFLGATTRNAAATAENIAALLHLRSVRI